MSADLWTWLSQLSIARVADLDMQHGDLGVRPDRLVDFGYVARQPVGDGRPRDLI